MTTTVAQPLTYRCPHCGTSMTVEPSTANEMLICPSARCGKPFKADVPVASPSRPLIVPGRQSEAPPQPVAVKAADAPAPERELARVQLTMFRRYPIRLLVYVLALAAGIVAIIWAWSAGWPMIAALAALGAAFPLYRLLAWCVRIRRTVVSLTDKRCRLTTGIFRPQVTEMLLEDVSEVQVRQSFFGRMLRVGDLVVVSSGEDRRQLVLMGVADPEAVAEHIRSKQ